MADQIQGSTRNMLFVGPWSIVSVYGSIFDHDLTEIRHAWLKDESRPGRWFSTIRLDKATNTEYAIEDPDVAMEFKIRFG